MVDQWDNCYEEGWQKVIVKEAFSHPAKFSRGLILRIYQHAKEMGWIESGDVVLDPFAGVALGAFHAGKFGLIWIGVELEEKFVKLAQENIKLWEAEDRAIIIQGDSRKIKELLEKADVVISSPPYVDSMNTEGCGIDFTKTKKDYPGRKLHDERIKMLKFHHENRKYGDTEGQLGSMKEGDVDLVVASPPYAEISQSGGTKGLETYKTGLTQGKRSFDEYGDTEGQLGRMNEGDVDLVVGSPPFSHGDAQPMTGTSLEKGKIKRAEQPKFKISESPENLANMKEGEVDAVVASPPYEECMVDTYGKNPGGGLAGPHSQDTKASDWSTKEGYGKEEGQLGHTSGDTFWGSIQGNSSTML